MHDNYTEMVSVKYNIQDKYVYRKHLCNYNVLGLYSKGGVRILRNTIYLD
jgi:hypothetical protein